MTIIVMRQGSAFTLVYSAFTVAFAAFKVSRAMNWGSPIRDTYPQLCKIVKLVYHARHD